MIDPYRSTPLRRTPAQRRAVRRRRVGRIVLNHLRGWIAYSAFWGVLALFGAFYAGTAITGHDETDRLEQRVEFYRKLLYSAHQHFYDIVRITNDCHAREMKRLHIP